MSDEIEKRIADRMRAAAASPQHVITEPAVDFAAKRFSESSSALNQLFEAAWPHYSQYGASKVSGSGRDSNHAFSLGIKAYEDVYPRTLSDRASAVFDTNYYANRQSRSPLLLVARTERTDFKPSTHRTIIHGSLTNSGGPSYEICTEVFGRADVGTRGVADMKRGWHNQGAAVHCDLGQAKDHLKDLLADHVAIIRSKNGFQRFLGL